MACNDVWGFGLNHLLTMVGFAITLGIAVTGFRTFAKWKREKIEEKRIDIALEALAIAYEAGFIFDGIRSAMSFDSEWANMQGVDDDRRRAAGPFYAILKRIENNRPFFERVWSIQPRFMAVFGKETADIFKNLHEARRTVEVSAAMLMRTAANNDPIREIEFRNQLEADVWSVDDVRDRIGPKLKAFVEGIEKRCLPNVEHRYAKAIRVAT